MSTLLRPTITTTSMVNHTVMVKRPNLKMMDSSMSLRMATLTMKSKWVSTMKKKN